MALASDYDGTLAHHGLVDAPTVEALQRFRDTGRKLILVTGRELDELLGIFPEIELFDRVVAENGALLYRPASREEVMLCEPADSRLVDLLERAGATPLSVGRTIVATREPYETAAIDAIRDLGLELQVIFNKGAVMILPSGVNKATGLRAALEELSLSPHNVIGVGDAENDHALLQLCECGVSVSNALVSLKERSDLVTVGDHGAGVTEVIDRVLDDDLASQSSKLRRHDPVIGTMGADMVRLAYGATALIAGPSGAGKSTLTTAILEAFVDKQYQFCIVDPEGDYENFESAVTVGQHQQPPSIEEVLEILQRPAENVVVNLTGLRFEERPAFFHKLVPRLQEMRSRTARPHWLVIDEAHHLLPAGRELAALALPRKFEGCLMITLEPERIAAAALHYVDLAIAVGPRPEKTLGSLAEAIERENPLAAPIPHERGQAIVWDLRSDTPPAPFSGAEPKSEHRRHRRKYVEGSLDPEECFYFRGPDNRLRLQAENLVDFLRIAEGVDDATWLHHLRNGEYSEWFRTMIKDAELAEEARTVEQNRDLSAAESLSRVRDAITRRYTV